MVAATMLALGSAGLHTAWNLLVKTSEDRIVSLWALFLVGGLLFLPLLTVIGVPDRAALPYLAASVLVHAVYVVALARAYEHGEFSFAYPVARGGGALVAAAGGVLFLDDVLRGAAWLAIALVAAGLGALARRPTAVAGLLWAGLTAAAIGTYTTLDAAGARRSSGFTYGVVLSISVGVMLSVLLLAGGRRADMGRLLRTQWLRYTAGGIATTLAYAMVLAAARLAPVGYVAALREVSVVLAAVAGWLLLGERLARARVMASVVVAAGLVLLVAAR
jgi:drug/metabolite transporter (DMT)-like permease